MGLAALLACSMASEPSLFFTCQAQPEPNRVTAFLLNSFLKFSKEPNAWLIASASAPVGMPPPLGFMQFQKKVWFQTWAALLKMPPEEFMMMSSRDMFSNWVPGINLLRLST